MTITPALAFDCCHEVYAAIRADTEGIPLIDPTKVPSDHVWRPGRGPRAGEYLADFSLCCRRGLSLPELASRRVLCNLYYLGLTPYERTRHFLGLREDTWVSWTEEIRDRVGKQILIAGLFPVRNYFGERTRPRRNAQRSAPTSAAKALYR